MWWKAGFWLVLDTVLMAVLIHELRRPLAPPEGWSRLASSLDRPTEGDHGEDQGH